MIKKSVTMSDIAKAVGVSTVTVSKALGDKDGVGSELREKIKQKAGEMGYQFSGSSSYVDLGSFSGKVTDQVREAVDMYLSDPTQFSHGYLSFYGDGSHNHFS